MVKTIKVIGMMCPHCEGRVREALANTPGISEVEVSHKSGKAKVTVETGIDDAKLVEIIENAGYKVKNIK